MTVIDGRARFAAARGRAAGEAFMASWSTCRYCAAKSTLLWMPHVDHRRRKPWPAPFGTCEAHGDQGHAACEAESHPRRGS